MSGPAAPLEPGAVIGILGGGQLGRMLAMAAARLGMRCHVFDPAPDGPAAQVAWRATAAPWDDVAALDAFAAQVDVVTLEFENIPLPALERIGRRVPVRPGPRSLEISADRLTEKRFLRDLGIATAPFAAVEDAASLARALDGIGTPAVLKTRRLGYDGKGQVRLARAADAGAALEAIGHAPAILEGLVPFEREISVICARGLDGALASYTPGENHHEAGILRRTRVPAPIPEALAEEARAIAGRIAEGLGHVGVLGVEFFVAGGRLLVNEIAPRVHNSGHWTQNGCVVDQFEQHIRAVAGWPLGATARIADVEMENLLGDEVARATQIAAEPGAALHLYGKAEARPGRKMGHVNRVLGPAREGG
ncbi:MAG: 5-(carboxyamino)imidazole ribonucleotide synthase [Alphaproteobacteria bacterium]|nr:MAG: 5-(carboxyamino)imidazole ribonucleotide synthase [Alphaproteobacteria bacterium]